MKKLLIIAMSCVLSSYSYAKTTTPHTTTTKDTWIAPNSLKILPPPPKENTVMFQSDIANFYVGRDIKHQARWKQAAEDANYKNIEHIFSSAFGYDISQKNTPNIYNLMIFILKYSHDHAVKDTKNYYMRVRPFAFFNMPSCTPDKEAKMRTTGSYPSGHASFGWAAALVLSEINPSRENELLNRGYEFGQSRVVCGAHWQSDVDAGRLMGGVIVSSFQNNPEYLLLLFKAKQEFKNIQHNTNASTALTQ